MRTSLFGGERDAEQGVLRDLTERGVEPALPERHLLHALPEGHAGMS